MFYRMCVSKLASRGKAFERLESETRLVEPAAHVDGRRLDDVVDDVGQRGQKVAGVDFGVEEDLGGQEALVADVDRHLAAGQLLDHVLLEALGFAVEARELLDDVGAHVAQLLLDLLGRLERRVGLAAVAQQRLHKVGDVAPCDRDRLDGRADDIALCLGVAVSSSPPKRRDFVEAGAEGEGVGEGRGGRPAGLRRG